MTPYWCMPRRFWGNGVCTHFSFSSSCLPRRAVATAASWVFGATVQDHRADVLECPPAELAGEIAGNVAVERFVVATVRIAYARVQKKSPQARVLLPAVDAVERAVGVALEQGVIAPSARMTCAGIMEKRPRIPIRLSAVFAVLTHVTCLCRRCL